MPSETKKPVRVWCDGCFDLVHYGHANSLRQAKQLGDVLVVGVHNDKNIAQYKGLPVFKEDERYKMIRGIKWVDEVVEGSTYWPTTDTLQENDCDFAAHGDDLSITKDGSDPYEALWTAEKLRFFKRTEGVSTTDIVGRMLLLTRDHHSPVDDVYQKCHSSRDTSPSAAGRLSKFLPTSRKIVQFSEGDEPKRTDKIVYVTGDFDLLHPGHLDFLEAAKKEGDYVIVGLHSDQVVNRKKGGNYPIMNLHERALSVLACRYANEVVLGAPYHITNDVLDHFKVDIVCHGWTKIVPDAEQSDPFEDPKKRGIFKVLDTGNRLTTSVIVERIIRNRLEYESRNKAKESREEDASFKNKAKQMGDYEAVITDLPV